LDNSIKLSNEEFAAGIFIIHNYDKREGDDTLKFYQYLLVDSTGKQEKTIGHICDRLNYKKSKVLTVLEDCGVVWVNV
jgi:hypothetical protein